MAESPPVPKPCCVCGGPSGKHCAKCKSRHYWNEGGHKALCRQLAVEFQDRLIDELMPLKLKIKEEPAVVADVAPADGSNAAARLPAVPTGNTVTAKASALNDDTLSWRGTCAICFEMFSPEGARRTFYDCCCKNICTDCSDKCKEYDMRCPLCRTPPPKSAAEQLHRLQKHVDKGNAEAHVHLPRQRVPNWWQWPQGQLEAGGPGLRARGGARTRTCTDPVGQLLRVRGGVKINYKTAALWYRRAAEQGNAIAQYDLGAAFYNGRGVAQSYDGAVMWWRLAAVQGDADALYNLGVCYQNGDGVPQDLHEALRIKCAMTKGHPSAAAEVEELKALLAAEQGR